MTDKRGDATDHAADAETIAQEPSDAAPTLVIRYYAMLRLTAGRKTERVELAAAPSSRPTFTALLHQLADRHGTAFRRWVLDDAGRPRPIAAYYNGEPLQRKAWSQPIPGGGDLALFPMVGGG